MYKHRMNTVMIQLEEVEKERDQVSKLKWGKLVAKACISSLSLWGTVGNWAQKNIKT